MTRAHVGVGATDASSVDPPPLEVTPGIWRIRLPLFDHGLGHVNVYALLANRRAMLIDTGWREPGSGAYLENALRLIGTSVAEVDRVLLTHFHSDHCGLAGYMRAGSDARIAIHPADGGMLRARYADVNGLRQGTARWLKYVGAPTDLSGTLIERAAAVVDRVVPFEADEDLMSGAVISTGPWEVTVLHTPGHSPGHVCFYERSSRTLFTGDHIFARLRTSPELRSHYYGDPIGEYLRSLTSLTGLDVAHVLPGHGAPVTDLGTRAQELRTYHRAQMERCLDALQAGASSVWEVAAAIPRRRTWGSLPVGLQISAVGQAFGHLVHLHRRGAVALIGDDPLRWDVRSRRVIGGQPSGGLVTGSVSDPGST